MHVFELWKKTRVPKENSHVHREKMQTPTRKDQNEEVILPPPRCETSDTINSEKEETQAQVEHGEINALVGMIL